MSVLSPLEKPVMCTSKNICNKTCQMWYFCVIQKRDMEAKELQRKIAERKLLLKAQTDAASARSLVGISTAGFMLGPDIREK